jgi:Carbamoyl-phosphate synthase L chain, ATP binding domain
VKPTALVVTTTNWVPTVRLAVAIGNAGFRVEMLCPPRHPVEKTRAASRTYTYHGLSPLRSLGRAIAAAKPDLVIPGDDLAARHLHEFYRQNGESSRPNQQVPEPSNSAGVGDLIKRSLGSPESFPIADERAAFLQLAREEGIRVPESGVIHSIEDVRNWIKRVGLPTVLKADGTSGGEGVRIVRTAGDADRGFRKLQAAPLLARAAKRAIFDQDRTLIWPSLLRKRPEVSAQAFVSGHEATSTIACWQGTVLASLHFEVLRKCKDAGHATVVRLIENAEMSTAVEKIAGRMGLSGLCGFDFMLEASTGNAYLIEINPRATQVGHITLGAGRDLPAALYGAVTGRPIRVAPTVTKNDTIALFPHEWARDAASEFLRSGYHDVPWDSPGLVQACIGRGRKQSAWYSREEPNRDVAVTIAPIKEVLSDSKIQTEVWSTNHEPSEKRTTHASNRF